MKLYVATKNQHKLKEIKEILSDVDVHSVYEVVDDSIDVEETGNTFLANASLKAKTLSAMLDEYVIADDSGITVDALDGAPGVYSARFAGPDATDEQNNEKLMTVMKPLPEEQCGASYVCVIALSRGGIVERTFSGLCEGFIAKEYKGAGGFGYDSMFLLPDGRHMAELTDKEKNSISHRNMALQELKEYLKTK
ncbi:MAG: non-canonical purine NTP pyrophosphatase, RdgB/HAM1 family [Denitrovibrio sp.]|nr:MAG: non-canonical purine NTP pyrophosphatase, RdgB/HAM1 family [Denitrovibrio sp.]